MENKQNTAPVNTCAHCGKEYQLKCKSKKYCSDSCKAMAWLMREEQKRRAREVQDIKDRERRAEISRAEKEKRRLKEQARKDQFLNLLEKVKKRMGIQEEQQSASMMDSASLNEALEKIETENLMKMAVLKFQNQMELDKAQRERERARKRREANRKRNYKPLPNLKPLPNIDAERIMGGIIGVAIEEIAKKFGKNLQ